MTEPQIEVETSSFRIDLGLLKTVFDWTWKVLPILWIAFQFYSNQDQLVRRSAVVDSKITGLETAINQMDRQLVEQKAEIQSLRDQIESDRQFYLQIQRPRGRP